MSSAPQSAVHLNIQGRVQGVGFRYFVQEAAVELGLVGWVRNLPNSAVEAHAEGPRPDLERWIAKLRQGPPLARIDTMQVDWPELQGALEDFSIR